MDSDSVIWALLPFILIGFIMFAGWLDKPPTITDLQRYYIDGVVRELKCTKCDDKCKEEVRNALFR